MYIDRVGSGMEMGRLRTRTALLVVFGIVLALAGGVAGCGSSEASENGNASAPHAAGGPSGYVKVVNVEARAVDRGPFTTYVRLTGSVDAYEDVVLSAEEAGVIERFFVDKGARVRSGQPIALIEAEVLRAQIDEAAAVAGLARERYERQRQLWEEEGIGSEIAYLQTRYDAESAAARMKLLQARLDRHTIESPIAGIVDDRYVDAGEIVVPGTQVARVLRLERLKIVGGVPERFGPYVQAGGESLITFDVLPGRLFVGAIGFVGNAVDRNNRTFPIEIVMDNPDGMVKPQMVANVRVATERLENVIVAPQDVVLRTESGYQVFVVVDREGVTFAEARDVVLGPSFENRVVIDSGLEAGDRLVIRGHQLVDPGDRVSVVGDGGTGR
jgi:membrane fusion protein (multidrug efflux system)